jgi:hypothetical protein
MDINKLTHEDLLEIFRGGRVYIDGVEFDYEIADEDEWHDGGKYDYTSPVFKHDNRFYRFSIERSGSYHRGYDFEIIDDCEEVEQITKTVVITEWVKV